VYVCPVTADHWERAASAAGAGREVVLRLPGGLICGIDHGR